VIRFGEKRSRTHALQGGAALQGASGALGERSTREQRGNEQGLGDAEEHLKVGGISKQKRLLMFKGWSTEGPGVSHWLYSLPALLSPTKPAEKNRHLIFCSRWRGMSQ
jgi:hypothetical protein